MKSRVGHPSGDIESASYPELRILGMVQMDGMILLLHRKLIKSLLLVFFSLSTLGNFSKPSQGRTADEEVIVTNVIH